MNLTIIADTHGLHDEIKLQKGTLLIHAGDITKYGTEAELIDFLEWFSKQPFTYKIFIEHRRNGRQFYNNTLFINTATVNSLERMKEDYRIAEKQYCLEV